MKITNIFIENIHTDSKVDEVTILKNLQKMIDYFLSMDKVVNASCLNGYEYNTLCFDVVLCDNEKIQEINKSYRNMDKPTDVITFAIFADSVPEERFVFDKEINLGEIIISVDKIEDQAKENGHSFESELYFLLAHGFLHCLGFEHKTDDDFNLMVSLQNEAKAVLNV